MRRYLRAVLLCLALAFVLVLYVFNESAEAEGGVRGPPTRSRRHGGGEAGPRSRYEVGRLSSTGSLSSSGRMHLAVVACGERLEETLTMLKSAVLFSQKPLCFHIFAEDELHDKFNSSLENWKKEFHQKFSHTIYPITFPADTAAVWKKLFKPCASQRLFLPVRNV